MQNKIQIEKDEGLKPIPKRKCTICFRDMIVRNGKYKCFKCGIELDYNGGKNEF